MTNQSASGRRRAAQTMAPEIPLFFAPPDKVHESGSVILPREEAVHAAKVMRRQVGDEVEVVDGVGSWYRVKLTEVTKTRVVGTVLEERREYNEPAASLRIGLGMLRSRQRMDIFLEKATELGITDIFPLVTDNSSARIIPVDRARRVMIAAVKQCRRSRIPQLHVPRPLEQMLSGNLDGLRCIAYAGAPRDLGEIVRSHPGMATTVLVGPESGFSDQEISHARSCGYIGVSLGPRRLRSETAALVAASQCMLSGVTYGAEVGSPDPETPTTPARLTGD